jgi:hypothetical protein
VRTGVAHTGVVGVLRGARAGKVVALRAEMDALMTEQVNLPFASRVKTTYNGRSIEDSSEVPQVWRLRSEGSWRSHKGSWLLCRYRHRAQHVFSQPPRLLTSRRVRIQRPCQREHRCSRSPETAISSLRFAACRLDRTFVGTAGRPASVSFEAQMAQRDHRGRL